MSRSTPVARLALLGILFAVGCSAPAPASVAFKTSGLTTTNGIASNGIASNGIASNGIASNGIASNGIASNGIASNGMDTNGLAPGVGTNGLAENGLVDASFETSEFESWFAKDPTYSDMVMTYVVRCAVAEGQALSFTTGAASHSWSGTFGLAPQWAAGRPIPQAERELVSACLAAHVNGFGQHVSISVRGYRADGQPIPVTGDEAASYTFREACYFGDLFDGSGTFMALEPDSLDATVSTPRGCAAELGVETHCPPMAYAGSCADLCQAGPDGVTWSRCTVNDVTYRPVRVFLSAASVNRCGDGVCAFPESSVNCPADCGAPAVP